MCGSDEAIKLAALTLQAEYGDYSLITNPSNYFSAEQFLPPKVYIDILIVFDLYNDLCVVIGRCYRP